MGSAKSKQGYRLNREDLEFLKASVPTVVELMNQNHNSHNLFFLNTVKSRAVDRSTIQFWNFLAKGHST